MNSYTSTLKKHFDTLRSKTELSIGFKLILSSILSALGGATFIGVLSEYATYYYSYSFGIRIPTEGVPYLSVLTSSLSFFVLFCSGIFFFIIYYFFKYVGYVAYASFSLFRLNNLFIFIATKLRVLDFFLPKKVSNSHEFYLLCSKILDVLEKEKISNLEEKINAIEPETKEMYDLFEQFIEEKNKFLNSTSKRSEISSKIKDIFKKTYSANKHNHTNEINNKHASSNSSENSENQEIDRNTERIINDFLVKYQIFYSKIQKTNKIKIFDKKGKEKEAVAFYMLYRSFLRYNAKKLSNNNLLAPYEVWKKISKILSDFLVICYRNINIRTFLFFFITLFLIINSLILIESPTKNIRTDFYFLIIFNIFYILPIILSWRPNLVWWLSIFLTICFSISIIITIFTPSYYANFLRATHFGGGIKIELTNSFKKSESSNDKISGYLLLRTKNSYFIFDNDKGIIIEIPSKKFNYILYSSLQEYKLPTF